MISLHKENLKKTKGMMKRVVILTGLTNLILASLISVGWAQSLVKIGQCKTGTYSGAVFLKGNYAYVSAGSELAIVNISNPASPWVEGSVGDPVYPMSCFAIDTIAYVYEGGSLWCVSVANPSSPYWFSYANLPRGGIMTYDGIYVRGDIAYLCVDQAGMYLVDISNPRTPAVTDSFRGGGWPIDIDMKDTLLYTTGYNPNAYYDSLLILNAANPHPIREIGSCSVFPWILDVVVSGNYAYTANWATGDSNTGVMNVVDVSNPRAPVVVAQVDSLMGEANAVCWDSNYVYVATRNYFYSDTTDTVVGGVRVVDVHNPIHPRVVAGYDLHYPHDGLDVKVRFPYVYVAGRDSFFVFQFTPSGVEGEKGTLARITPEVELLQNAPNPVRDRTEIGYQVSKRGFLEISIYDIAGRKVKELVRGERLPGTYRTTWDRRDESGKRVTAGMYFYRMEAGGEGKTRKMVVIC